MQKKAFTLAEVLVTLGIVGIVSAMTVPALTQNWQRRAYVTQLHKVYNEFQQAFKDEMADKHASNLNEVFITIQEHSYGANGHERDFLFDHFKVVKNCAGDPTDGCFSPRYKTINGTVGVFNPSGHAVTIAGGAALALDIYHSMSDHARMGTVTVDINGTKGPNVVGRDLFVMFVYPDGKLDTVGNPAVRNGNATQARENNFNNNCRVQLNTDGAVACFGKILNDNWEMNY
jgi:prepilin-type N-terminal cleavage/methylation domain-containing protein